MKLLFFSDIHGVPAALEKLLDHADRLAPDKLLLLGDVLYHGPRNGVPVDYDTSRTAALLNERADMLLAVRGNCDSEVDQMMLTFPILADFAEVLTDGGRFFLTHGHHWNAAHLPPLVRGTVLAHGHTHLPENRLTDDGIRIFNPGSISLPKGGNPPTFGFFDGNTLSICRLDDGSLFG